MKLDEKRSADELAEIKELKEQNAQLSKEKELASVVKEQQRRHSRMIESSSAHQYDSAYINEEKVDESEVQTTQENVQQIVTTLQDLGEKMEKAENFERALFVSKKIRDINQVKR